jgi:hypothetical protein
MNWKRQVLLFEDTFTIEKIFIWVRYMNLMVSADFSGELGKLVTRDFGISKLITWNCSWYSFLYDFLIEDDTQTVRGYSTKMLNENIGYFGRIWLSTVEMNRIYKNSTGAADIMGETLERGLGTLIGRYSSELLRRERQRAVA